MKFVWDEHKNLKNLRKHGFGFEAAAQIFGDPFAVTIEDQLYGDEVRYKTIGRLQNLTLAVVIHIGYQEGGDIRIISARKGDPNGATIHLKLSHKAAAATARCNCRPSR